MTHNYRLGSLGYLAHPALTDEDAGNYEGAGSSGNQGLFDSLMALQWVVDNAETFGGDPNQLMIFGESAGGVSTCALLASPLAQGLFTSALIQSAGCVWVSQPLSQGSPFEESGEAKGERLGSALGCSGSEQEQLDCMRAASTQEVIDAFGEESYSPLVDGVFIPNALDDMFASGDFSPVTVVAGVNDNEGVMFSSPMGITTEAELNDLLEGWAAWLGFSDSDELEKLYNVETYGDPQIAYDYLYGDVVFVCPTRRFLKQTSAVVPTYAYWFADVPDWLSYYPELSTWGAFHGAELEYVFGSHPDWYSFDERELASQMRQAWIAVATGEQQDYWAEFGTTQEELDAGGQWTRWDTDEVTVETGFRKAECDYLLSTW